MVGVCVGGSDRLQLRLGGGAVVINLGDEYSNSARGGLQPEAHLQGGAGRGVAGRAVAGRGVGSYHNRQVPQ